MPRARSTTSKKAAEAVEKSPAKAKSPARSSTPAKAPRSASKSPKAAATAPASAAKTPRSSSKAPAPASASKTPRSSSKAPAPAPAPAPAAASLPSPKPVAAAQQAAPAAGKWGFPIDEEFLAAIGVASAAGWAAYTFSGAGDSLSISKTTADTFKVVPIMVCGTHLIATLKGRKGFSWSSGETLTGVSILFGAAATLLSLCECSWKDIVGPLRILAAVVSFISTLKAERAFPSNLVLVTAALAVLFGIEISSKGMDVVQKAYTPSLSLCCLSSYIPSVLSLLEVGIWAGRTTSLFSKPAPAVKRYVAVVTTLACLLLSTWFKKSDLFTGVTDVTGISADVLSTLVSWVGVYLLSSSSEIEVQ